jgi:hypothetical protein
MTSNEPESRKNRRHLRFTIIECAP